MRYDWKCQSCADVIIIERPMAQSDVGPDDPCQCGAHEYKKMIAIDVKSKNFILEGRGWHDQCYSKTRSIN